MTHYVDTDALIAAMKTRRPLWEKDNATYQNRNVRLTLWKEVAAEAKCSVHNAKKRWHNVRDQYRMEIKKMQQSSSSSSPYITAWRYFESMTNFNDAIINPRHSAGETSAELVPKIELVDNGSSWAGEELTEQTSRASNGGDGMEEVEEYMKEEDGSYQQEGELNLFLRSLIPAMNSIPYHRQLYLRAKIQELVAEEVSKCFSGFSNSANI